MKWLLVAILLMIMGAADDAYARRSKVYINKPSQPVHTGREIPLAAVAPLAVAFDLARRTSCDVRVAVGTGKGDPGFDPAGPTTGNFLVPAIYRSQCGGARPKWYKW